MPRNISAACAPVIPISIVGKSANDQRINEFLSVCRTKLGFDIATRHRLASELLAGCNVVALDSRVVMKAMEIESESGISFWDALIVAAAILSGCETLYSEDFQHLRVFDGQLTVVNPFV